MASSRNQHSENEGFCWLGIVRTLIVQVLVLLALSAAVVRYLDWSSDSAWAEFNAASGPAVSAAKAHAQSAMPLQSVRKQVPCG
jgi:hypothetical protein